MAGGTGATTVAVNLAWELATIAKTDAPKVCLIDLDLQFGSVATYLDLPRRETKPLPGFPVDRIEPGTVHPDEHLIVSGDWHIGRDHLQDVTLTKAIVDHMAHRGFSVLIGSIFHEDLRTTG